MDLKVTNHMWAPYWAHIIGDHRRMIQNILLEVNPTSCPCMDFPTCMLGSSPHSMFPIASNCLGMPYEQGMAPTKLHQIYPECQASSHLEPSPSYLAWVSSSYAACQRWSSFAFGWPQCAEFSSFASHWAPPMLFAYSSMIDYPWDATPRQLSMTQPQTQWAMWPPIHTPKKMEWLESSPWRSSDKPIMPMTTWHPNLS